MYQKHVYSLFIFSRNTAAPKKKEKKKTKKNEWRKYARQMHRVMRHGRVRLLCALNIIQIYYGRERNVRAFVRVSFEQRLDDNVIKYNNDNNNITRNKIFDFCRLVRIIYTYINISGRP